MVIAAAGMCTRRVPYGVAVAAMGARRVHDCVKVRAWWWWAADRVAFLRVGGARIEIGTGALVCSRGRVGVSRVDSKVDATAGGMELMEVMGERRARAGATLAKAKGGKSEGYWLVRCQPPPTVSAHVL